MVHFRQGRQSLLTYLAFRPAFSYFFLNATWIQLKKLTMRIFLFQPIQKNLLYLHTLPVNCNVVNSMD